MAQFDRKDHFYKMAKKEGKASRAYYKLEQIQKKYKILKRGDRVVDLGCAPGGWIEEASKIIGPEGKVFGIDLLPLKIFQPKNLKFVQGDIGGPETLKMIEEYLGKADAVLSDMAPDISGIKFRDSYLSYELAMKALEVADRVLKTGGNFIAKIFPGEEFAGFKKELEKRFKQVTQVRPEATRKTSIEVYLVGLGYECRHCERSN